MPIMISREDMRLIIERQNKSKLPSDETENSENKRLIIDKRIISQI